MKTLDCDFNERTRHDRFVLAHCLLEDAPSLGEYVLLRDGEGNEAKGAVMSCFHVRGEEQACCSISVDWDTWVPA